MLNKLIILLISLLVLCVNCDEQKIKNNILYIKDLNCYLNLHDWNYSDDQKLIGKVKTILKETDKTGIVKANVDEWGIQFFIFENKMGTPVEFNTNINLLVQDISKYPGITSMRDFIEKSKSELPIILNNVEVRDTKFVNINGYECGIIEADYDQNVGYKTFSLSVISMSILKNNKAFVFSGTTLQKQFAEKKPLIEKILFSIKPK